MRLNPKTYDKSGMSKLDRFRKYYSEHPDQFIEKYAKIRIKSAGAPIQTLILKPSQRQVVEVIEEQRRANQPIRLVILKSRQVGISTLVAAYVFAQCYAKDNMEAMVMAHEKDVTTNLFRTYHRYLEHLPSELQLALKRSSKEQLLFEDTGTLIQVATAGSAHSTRSRTIQWFHGSEAAFYKDLKTLKQAMEGSVPEAPNCGIIWETTAFGTNNAFHDLWLEAEDPDSIYAAVFLEWFKDPDCSEDPRKFPTHRELDDHLEKIFSKRPGLKDRMDHFKLTPLQIAFYYRTLMNKFSGDEKRMATEYPCDPAEAFVATGDPIFPLNLANLYKLKTREGTLYDPTLQITSFDSLKESPHLERNKDSYLEVWVPPQQKRHYVISVDPAAGLETSDYSAAYVFDILTQNIVAELHGRIEPKKMAEMLIPLAKIYNNAMIAPENDGLGTSLLGHIKDKYFNIYQYRKLDGFGWKLTNILGWETTEQTRLEAITTARRLFTERQQYSSEFVPSKMLVHEIMTFVHGNLMKAEASRGAKDDRVMAWVIGLSVCLQELQCRPDLAALAQGVRRDAEEDDTGQTPEDLIRMIKDPRWTGQPLDDLGYDTPFLMELDRDEEDDE